MIFVSSACVRAKKISEVLLQYSKAGIKNIELSGGTSYYPQIENDLLYYGKKYGIKYVCHSYFPPAKNDFVINLAACNDEIYMRSIEHYKDCIGMLKRMEIKVLSIHAGFFIEITPKEIGRKLSGNIIYDEEKAIDRFCSAYELINKMCKENGINLYLENNVLNQENFERFGKHNLLMLTDYDAYKKLREQLDFELLLDLGHLHVSACTLSKDYESECLKFSDYAKWIHLSENNGILDQHRPLQKNSEIVRMYKKYFDTGIPVTLETNGRIDEIISSVDVLTGE